MLLRDRCRMQLDGDVTVPIQHTPLTFARLEACHIDTNTDTLSALGAGVSKDMIPMPAPATDQQFLKLIRRETFKKTILERSGFLRQVRTMPRRLGGAEDLEIAKHGGN